MFAHDLCHSQIEYLCLPVESLPSRASGSNDRVERSILIEKTERAYSAEKATKARSDTTNLQSSIFNSGSAGLGVYRIMYGKKLIAAMAAWIFLTSVPVALGMRSIALDESPGLTDKQGSSPLKQNSILLAANDNNKPGDTEKAASGSESKGSETESKPTVESKEKSSKTKPRPLKPFVPSEKIPGDQAVDFPVDI